MATRKPFDDPVTERILAAAIEVHRTLGPGFEEVIYQRALEREFAARDLDCSREEWVDVLYKGEKVGSKRVDFIVETVLVEIKARRELDRKGAQTLDRFVTTHTRCPLPQPILWRHWR